MSQPRIRVAVVDDHPVVRLGLRKVIDAQPDMIVVAEAADGVEAVRVLLEARPDVTLMDLRMPGAEAPPPSARSCCRSRTRASSSSPPSTETRTSTGRSRPARAATC